MAKARTKVKEINKVDRKRTELVDTLQTKKQGKSPRYVCISIGNCMLLMHHHLAWEGNPSAQQWTQRIMNRTARPSSKKNSYTIILAHGVAKPLTICLDVVDEHHDPYCE